jgi:hypothetical protein
MVCQRWSGDPRLPSLASPHDHDPSDDDPAEASPTAHSFPHSFLSNSLDDEVLIRACEFIRLHGLDLQDSRDLLERSSRSCVVALRWTCPRYLKIRQKQRHIEEPCVRP